jgi:hypothetical protein
MVHTKGPNRHRLFSECFEHILKTQQGDGSWLSYGTHYDSVLNSLAALLVFIDHCTFLQNDNTSLHQQNCA